MSDFGDMLRESLLENEPYRPEQGVEQLELSLLQFHKRMRTVRALGAAMVLGPSVLVVAGVWLFVRAAPLADDVEGLLWAVLALFGLSAVGMGKFWFQVMVAQVQFMRELKALQLAVARLAKA